MAAVKPHRNLYHLLSEDVSKGVGFLYIKDAVNVPVFNRCAEWVAGRGIPPSNPKMPLQVEKLASKAVREAEAGPAGKTDILCGV